MKIVIAVCKKDLPLAESQAQLIKKLGGLQAHSCLLVVAPEANRLEGKLADTLASAFPRFERHILQGGVREPSEADRINHPQPHVLPANQMFQATVKHLIATGNKEEWFWMEPDCTPLNDRWADELTRDYLTANAFKKVFLGPLAPRTEFIRNAKGGWELKVHQGQTFMVGTSVYPPNLNQHSGLWSQAKATPWDALMQWETAKLGQETRKIVHNHGTANYKVAEPMLPGKDGVLSCEVVNPWGISTETLRIPADALIIHGCKDDTLINLVSSGALFKAPTNKAQKADAKVDTKGFVIEG